MSNRGWFPLQDRRRPTLEPVQPAPDQDPLAIPVSPAVPESPGSPDGSAYSPTDTPTKRTTPSPPSYSPNRLACERSLYVARQDHQFALPDCPDNRPPRPPGPPYSAVNPPLQPAPEPHRARVRRRRAPDRWTRTRRAIFKTRHPFRGFRIWAYFSTICTCPELIC